MREETRMTEVYCHQPKTNAKPVYGEDSSEQVYTSSFGQKTIIKSSLKKKSVSSTQLNVGAAGATATE